MIQEISDYTPAEYHRKNLKSLTNKKEMAVIKQESMRHRQVKLNKLRDQVHRLETQLADYQPRHSRGCGLGRQGR